VSVPARRSALVNKTIRADRVPVPPGADVMRFHQRIPSYRPTPLRSLTGIADDLGLRAVTMKDESDRFGLPAFKILGATWAVERALRRRPATRMLVAASAGNHGRAVARCAAQRGLTCRIYLPAGTSAERASPILAEGAEVVYIDGGYDQATKAARLGAREPGAALIADFSPRAGAASPAWVIEGYATLFREAVAQLTEPVDLVLVPIGVGSLAAAAVRWAVHEGGRARVVGVEPTAAACVTESLRAGRPVTVPTPGTGMTGLDCATPSAVAWPTIRDGLAGTVTVGDLEVHEAMRELAALGLAIGDCGAAPFAALWRLASDNGCRPLRNAVGFAAGATVLCVATEGPTDMAAYRAVVER
jgi:diaminopropionate ammonia-lyase